MSIKTVSTNRKARHDYFILDEYEAGLVLRGSEIKSIRAGHISIKESYIKIDEREAWLVNAHIAMYEPASRQNHDPLRPRKLLLHKKELQKLWDEVRQKGVTIIPLRVYIKNGKAKIEIAAAKGKKKYDKRAELARKTAEMEMRRQIKSRAR